MKSRKNFMLLAGVIAAGIQAFCKAIGIDPPIDDTTMALNIGMIMWWVYDRRKVDEKIKVKKTSEMLMKWRDPGFWVPWIALPVQVLMHYTAIVIPVYIVPVAASIVASLFNHKGPHAPK